MEVSGVLERYRNLGLSESLLRPHDYPSACKELSFILRSAYPKLPKTLQHVLFQDTLAAFRVLPNRVQTQSGMAAANILLKAAEVAFPKQKRVLVVSEFKHSVVAYKRNCKNQQVEGELPDLPQDILVQIFSLLDLRSFVSAGLVCWSWNAASNDEKLWRLQYDIFFGSSSRSSESKVQMCKSEVNTNMNQNIKGTDQLVIVNWREAFKRAYLGAASLWLEQNKRPFEDKNPSNVEFWDSAWLMAARWVASGTKVTTLQKWFYYWSWIF